MSSLSGSPGHEPASFDGASAERIAEDMAAIFGSGLSFNEESVPARIVSPRQGAAHRRTPIRRTPRTMIWAVGGAAVVGLGIVAAAMVVPAERGLVSHREARVTPPQAAASSLAPRVTEPIQANLARVPIAADIDPHREAEERGTRTAPLHLVAAPASLSYRERGHDCAGSESARCTRENVLAADRALRVAYADAIDAGMPRGRLLRIRDDWAQLSDDEYGHPAILRRGYQQLTAELRRMIGPDEDE